MVKNQIAKRQAFYMSLDAARRKLGKGITVASLGTVRKGTNDDGTPVAREVFDGTHGVIINQAIKVRDQGAAPGAPDVECAGRAGSIVPVGCGHRRRPQSGASSRGGLATPVLQSGRGCRPVRTNETVGTFGVVSASYCWEPAAGALSRLTQYVVSKRAFFWLHMMADDLDIEAAGPGASLSSQFRRSWGFQSHGRRCAAAPWSNGSAMNSASGSIDSELRQAGPHGR